MVVVKSRLYYPDGELPDWGCLSSTAISAVRRRFHYDGILGANLLTSLLRRIRTPERSSIFEKTNKWSRCICIRHRQIYATASRTYSAALQTLSVVSPPFLSVARRTSVYVYYTSAKQHAEDRGKRYTTLRLVEGFLHANITCLSFSRKYREHLRIGILH